ncbi:MAG: hypothetical protein IJQ06_07875 [Paludibacteraceae bacterium]|nr:hypothetical protein [Paludibacteraceae bacterium]
MKKFFSFVAATLVALTMNAQAISVAEAIAACMALDSAAVSESEYTIEGFVVDAQDFNPTYGNQIFFLADDATNSQNQQFEVYGGIAKDNDVVVKVLNGDKVNVTAKLKKYYDRNASAFIAETVSGAVVTFISKVDGDRAVAGSTEINVAKALEIAKDYTDKQKSPDTYDIVGYVTNIIEDAMESHGNMTFWMADANNGADSNEKGAIEVYRGKPAEVLAVGDKISIKTQIQNYGGVIETVSGAAITILQKGEGGGETPVEDADVVFNKDDFAGQGTSSTGSEVKATKNGVTFWCDKAYGDGQYGVRCYKDGNITITSETEQIAKIVFEFGVVSGDTKDGGLDAEYVVNAKEWKAENLVAQARMNTIKVYFGTAEVPVIEPITVAKALEIAQALTPDVKKSETTAETYAVQGFIVGTSSKNENTWYMADEAGAYGEFQAYKCKSVDYEVAEGDLVIVTGKISTYHGEGSNGEYYSYEISGGALKHVYGQGLDKVEAAGKAQKVMIDGVVYILRDGKMFNTLGTQVR